MRTLPPPAAAWAASVALVLTAFVIPVRAADSAAQPGARCSPGATTLNPLATMLQLTSPESDSHWRGSLSVSGTIVAPDLPDALYLVLRDSSGGALADSFVQVERDPSGGLRFSHTFDVAVALEMPACLWVSLPVEQGQDVFGQLLALVPVVLQPTAGPPATMGRTTPFFENNTGPDLVAAATAYVQARSNVPIVDARIVRVVKNWAAVRVFPPLGVTDPATVILTRQGSTGAMLSEPDRGWQGVTYGTGALCLDPNDAVPPILCEYDLAYAGRRADDALAVLDGGSGRRTYQGRFMFDYPADGRVFEPAVDPFKVRVQRFLAGSLAPVYDIQVQATAAGPGTVDQWGYSRMIAETTDLTLCPVTGTYFETGDNAVFQVDCVTGAALQRRFYLTGKGATGGPAALVTLTIPPEGLNPWQPLADAALTLLLRTLYLGGENGGPRNEDR